ncbi:divalent-cation tolerance protein CutA [Mesorhizobium xinjiangense]|uniref:divalent-cation tolerance protein CutA n=1 Tax=Mesorhizobium xinjiangense TaxID=2678685 RepID=UPI0012ECEB98|nr:divalent-cation tolerance protein CutA [Mesorhizobium xinjiangense]
MIELHVTFANAVDAARMARAALKACANIVDGVRSLYWWQGAIEEEDETLAIFKTSEAKADALEALIAEHHPYDTPAIIRHTAVTANQDYARWVEKETA